MPKLSYVHTTGGGLQSHDLSLPLRVLLVGLPALLPRAPVPCACCHARHAPAHTVCLCPKSALSHAARILQGVLPETTLANSNALPLNDPRGSGLLYLSRLHQRPACSAHTVLIIASIPYFLLSIIIRSNHWLRAGLQQFRSQLDQIIGFQDASNDKYGNPCWAAGYAAASTQAASTSATATAASLAAIAAERITTRT